MPISKKYLHDKFILSLVSVTAFLAIACIILILLRFGAGGGGSTGYIVQYRANLGISAFKTGDVSNIFSFALFAPLVAAFTIIFSARLYTIRRELSVAVLALGILILTLAIIVSNALLVLR